SASLAAQHILKSVYRVDLRKALNPLNDADFVVIVKQLTDSIHAITGPVEKRAVEVAWQMLDVDFHNMSSAQAAQLAHATNLALRGVPAQVLPAVVGKLRTDTSITMGDTKVS